MTNNTIGKNPNPGNDTSLIQEDAEVFAILIPSEKRNLSKFEEVSGLIAYAQYSLQKHQFIKKYEQEEGQPPTKDHIHSIILSFRYRNSATLLSLKQKSENLLREYAKEYLENVQHREIIEPIEKIVKKHTNFWSSIWTSLVAAFLYSFVVAIIIFTATAAVPNNKFSQIIRILLEEQPNSANPNSPNKPK